MRSTRKNVKMQCEGVYMISERLLCCRALLSLAFPHRGQTETMHTDRNSSNSSHAPYEYELPTTILVAVCHKQYNEGCAASVSRYRTVCVLILVLSSQYTGLYQYTGCEQASNPEPSEAAERSNAGRPPFCTIQYSSTWYVAPGMKYDVYVLVPRGYCMCANVYLA